MKEGKGDKSIRYQYKFVIFSYSIWLNFGVHAQVNRKLEIILAFLVNRDRENRQSKAGYLNISVEDATKLRSQAIAITFEDINSCINVSVATAGFMYYLKHCEETR